MINKETLEAYFRKIKDDGWRFARKGEKNETWWHATYRAGGLQREVYLVLDTEWIYFQLPFNIEVSPDCRLALYHYLLRLNDRIFAAKFSIDEQNKMVLMAELPVRNFDFTTFTDVLRTLVNIADNHFRELEILASDVKVVGIITGEEQPLK
jgi:hypothetical protein